MPARTTLNSARAWAPDVVAFVPADAVPDALILKCSTVATTELDGDAPVAMVPFVRDDEADFVAEGATIDTAEPELAMAQVRTGKISLVVRVSNEMYYQANTAAMLSESSARAVMVRANEAFVAQDAPTPPAVAPPPGLLNVNGLTDIGELTEPNLDELIDLSAALQAAGATPSMWLLAPSTWAYLRRLKTDDTDSNESLLGAGTNDAERALLDVPVLVSSAVPEGGGLLIDRSAIVSAAGPVNVATSDSAFFAADSTALRITWRIGHEVMHPERIGQFSVPVPSSA